VRTTDLAFSGFVLLMAIGYEAMAWWMPQGSLKFPGPGYYPKLVGMFLIATALGCLIQAAVARPSARPVEPLAKAPPRPMVGKTVALLGLLLGYAILLTPLGYPIAIFLFLLAAIRVFGYRRWTIIILLALALTVVSYVTFITWLKVPLPLGVVGDLLD
jgi:putative tricarboxylic transport membrane protein